MRHANRARSARLRVFTWCCLAPLLAAAGAPAATNGVVYELHELTVSPTSNESRLPEGGSMATRLDEGALASSAAPHLQQVLGLAPNLTWAGGTSRPRYFQMRGIGERSQFAGEGPPNFSVGFLVDDMDLSGIGMHGSLFDVATVDILRGPQAAVFGAKALAGLIDLRTTDPSPYPGGRAQLTLGTEDTYGIAAAVGGPLMPATPEVLTTRVSVERAYQNGFRHNEYLNRDDTNARDEWTTRVKVRWEPDPEMTWALATLWSQYDNGYDEFTPDNNGFTTYADNPGRDRQNTWGGSLRGTWYGPDRYRVLSISSFVDSDIEYSYDADWGNDDFWAAAPYHFDPAVEGYRYDYTERLQRTRRNATQDFRLISEPGGEIFGGSSAWHLGVYGAWLGEDDDYDGFDNLRSHYDAVSAALYGQLSTRVAPSTVWRNALRVEERGTDYRDDQGVRFDGNDTMWGGRTALEHKLDAGLMVFAGLSRGFKGGGVNQDPALEPDRRHYAPETLWNLETGAKASLFGGHTDIALTLFHMWRDDLQIGTSYQADPADPSSFVYFTDNAAAGHNLGAELEATQALGKYVELFATLALLDTAYSDYSAADGADRLQDREQPYAPRFSYRTGAQWHGARGFFARVEVEGKDAFYLSDEHDARTSPYALLHVLAGYGRDGWRLTLWGRNVLDEEYVTRGYVFGLEPPDFEDTLYVTYGDPIHLGATFDVTF